LCDGAEMAIFLRPVFAASCVQRISDLHSKFALKPHHVPKYDKHPRRRKKKKQDENIMVCPITQVDHNNQ